MQQVDYSNVQLSLYETIVLKLIRIFRSEIWYKRETINILRQYGFIKPYKYDVYTNPLLKKLLEAIMSLFENIVESLEIFR